MKCTPEVRAAGVGDARPKQVQRAQLDKRGEVRQAGVRHVAAVQVQVREARQRGDRLQPRIADTCIGELGS